jgi:hypothetical protein
MTITLNLSPETERRLHERASANGQTMEIFIGQVLKREVVDAGGTPAATGLGRSKPLDEILEPVRREFEASGMTQEELVQFLTEVRDEVRGEIKHARLVG